MRIPGGLRGLGILVAALAIPGVARGDSKVAHPYIALDSNRELHRLVERERLPNVTLGDVLSRSSLPGIRPPSMLVATKSSLDCIHTIHDVSFDPHTGNVSATFELELKADGSPLHRIGLTLDRGLSIDSATMAGRTLTVDDDVVDPARVVQIAFGTPLASGETARLRIMYSGTLMCGTYPDSGAIVCTKGQDFSYFPHQSLLPYIFDPIEPSGLTLDAMTRDIVLRVPSQYDVVATGERLGETTQDGIKVSRWTIDKPLSRTYGMYVFAGKLGLKTIEGRSVPTTLVFPAPELPIDQRLASWSTPVLDFVDRLGGGRPAFARSLSLVRLPALFGDPGTATSGMTLLSDAYAKAGDLMHEETWAHENAHLYWGIVVPEKNLAESRLMSEGMATLAEIDYTWFRHFADVDRDTYLAQRFLPIGLDIHNQSASLPPVAVAPGNVMSTSLGTDRYTLWAYYKTAAVLDHLRVTVGDEAFERGLAEYVRRCSYVGCRPDALRAVLDSVTGKDLGPFFDRWVFSDARPVVRVGFTEVPGGLDVDLLKDDEVPMSLALRITLADGRIVTKSADLAGTSTRVRVDTDGPVRSVSLNPRHDVFVDSRSNVAGDLDFDGESDGFDVLRCASQLGRSYGSSKVVALWNITETFDPRCDTDGDMKIDDNDVDRLARDFGTLRAR